MDVFNVKYELPEDRTYVLAHYTRGNWSDSDHQQGCEWKVVKFIRGISASEREAMEDCPRKRTHCSEDEGMDNNRPYCWKEFGPTSLFGQDVDFWANLPLIIK